MIFVRARDVFRAVALHSVACIAFEFEKFGTKVPLDPISNSGSDFKLGPCIVVLLALQYTILPWFQRQSWQHAGVFRKNLSLIVAVFYIIVELNTPSATAADDLPLMKLNFLQTRKRCKRPSAKRAPGIHPGLFQISRFFRARLIRQTFPPVKRSNQCFG